MNNIAELQNKPSAIEKLAAQRYLYSKVKMVFIIHSLIAVLIAILFPIIRSNYPTSKSWLAIIALSYLVIQFILDEWESSKRKLAAKIQELFDVDVLSINWNHIAVGPQPDQEIIGQYQNKITEKNRTTLYNWYPPAISKLSDNIAKIICQRANIWWDSTLRRKFTYILILILAIATGFLFWLNRHTILVDVITNLAPFAPLFQLLIKQIISHHKSAKRLDNLKDALNLHIENAKQNKSYIVDDCAIRSIQDEIFRHRSSVLPIPDFFYWLFRKRYENLMNFNANSCANDLLS